MELEEDVAQPIFRTRSKGFMEFGDLSDEHSEQDIRDDTSMIPRLHDDGTQPSQVTLSPEPDPQDMEECITPHVLAESIQDHLMYETYRNKSAESLASALKTATAAGGGDTEDVIAHVSIEVKQLFELTDDDVLQKHYPAWLLKSVMLQGHLFVMRHALCFYSYIPEVEDVTIKSGYLGKRSRSLAKNQRRWFILKNNILSYYESAAELYFPRGIIDLKQALFVGADLKHLSEPGFGFKLVTSQQEYFFRADTASSVVEWIKVLHKVMFRLNNDGDCVKITIPYSSILDVEESNELRVTETMKVRIADDSDTFAINEYYFALFEACEAAVAMVRDKVDTQAIGSTSTVDLAEQLRKMPILDTSKNAPAYHRAEIIDAMVAFRQDHPEIANNIELLSHGVIDQRNRQRRALTIDRTISKAWRARSRSRSRASDDRTDGVIPRALSLGSAEVTEAQQKISGLSVGVSRLLGSSMRTVGRLATSAYRLPSNVTNLLSADGTQADTTAADEAAAGNFLSHFGLGHNERLLRVFSSFFGGRLPQGGDLYISDERVCFRCTTPGSRLRVVVPLGDIESAATEEGFHFGFAGLIMKIRAHEDMFFEFTHSNDRDQCLEFVKGALQNLEAIEDHRQVKRRLRAERAEVARQEHIRLVNTLNAAGFRKDVHLPSLENVIDVPPVIFDSPSASMVAFKPQKQMRFTCLTIGSRGDVQPYVALCKGLIADGQRAKIATHEEFREFVTGHGIEFAPIDGNPAELMSICVEHGMFTYSFLREASQKFRGWIDGLLKSSWAACQNSDIIIESPSAMGGIHIAEALGVPYYRAFTMPWSKTRVYPHAFAVPDHNMGGNYNALTYTAFDNLFWKAISGQVNRWRKKTLNLSSTTYDKLAQHKVPFLYNFSPSVVPPARDWHEWIRVTGYWFLDNSDDKTDHKWEAPEKVIAFIKSARIAEKKLVYIGFGSIVVADPGALTTAVVTAVKQADVRCILVKGWSARSSHARDESDDDDEPNDGIDKDDRKHPPSHAENKEMEDFGENILSLDSIPHDWLFPQIDAACHHGGAGSLGASLRAGVPTIVKPFFGDQHFFGSRVQDLGVGICLQKLTVKSLSKALVECTTNRGIIQKAQKIGEQIRSERGVENAIESIYRDLEYAKSLIKSPQRVTAEGSETSGESYEVVEHAAEEDDEEDDEDLFETRTDENGIKSSILRPFKYMRLPNPIGDKYGSYGFGGMNLLKSRGERGKGGGK